jgi:hypothetical protein
MSSAAEGAAVCTIVGRRAACLLDDNDADFNCSQLILIWAATEPKEWTNRISYFPI